MTRAEALRIFELDDHATQEQVRAAYRELVKVWHPDRFVGDAGLRDKANRRLREINLAYAVLQDRAETVETPQEPIRRPHVPTPRSENQWMPARWSRTTLATVGVLTSASVIGIVMMLVRSRPAAELPEKVEDVAPNVTLGNGTPQKAAAFRPVSGTDLLAVPGIRGSSLIALNTDRRDAVLVFVDAGVQTRAVYIRAGERLQMLDVAPGTYRIWIAGGQAWNRDHFATDQTFQELDGPLTFANDDSAPQTISIGAPRPGARTALRARSPFLVNLQR